MTYLGASAAALATDRNNWHTNANTAYDSGVWGSGTHWQSRWSTTNNDLTNMTNDRNNWQSSSNTWQGRANTAWGSSRVWNSGESWEAAYNRVLPPAGVGLLHTTFSAPGYGDVCSITVDRTGYWMAFVNANANGNNGTMNLYFIFNGVNGISGTFVCPVQSSQYGWSTGYDGAKLLSVGQTIKFHIATVTSAASSGDMWAVFVPTAAYPH